MRSFFLFVTLLFTSNTFAWSDHSLLTYYMLLNTPSQKLNQFIPTETLEEFLGSIKKNHAGELSQVISRSNQWAILNMPGYHSTPDNLHYDESHSRNNAELFLHFFRSIRVNPHTLNLIYVRELPSIGCNSKATYNIQFRRKISNIQPVLPAIFDQKIDGLKYQKLNSGENVPACLVLETAADEADLGMDIGLFSDNHTEFSALYGFGKQPFGDNRVSFSSQAPFHYGAYHESSIVYLLAPQTKESYAEYRIKLFRDLAKFAFSTNHPYWGYRFLGIGLHYLQDLNQPYHAKYFPGFYTSTILANYSLSLIGFQKYLTNKINLVANRHFLLEDFLQKLIQNNNTPSASQFIHSLQDGTNLSFEKLYDDTVPRSYVAKDAEKESEIISNALTKNFPKKYVSDPSFFYTKKSADGLEIFSLLSKSNKKNIEKNISKLLINTGFYSRIYLKDFM